MVIRHWVGLAILLMTFISPLDALNTDHLRLKAGVMDFEDMSHLLKASSNVELSIGDTTIKSPSLLVDTERRWLFASEGVQIDRGDHYAFAKTVSFNIDTGVAELSDARVTLFPSDIGQAVYLSGHHVLDDGSHYQGEHGRITSCSLPEPHYYFKASRFNYQPDKRIVGRNVFLYYPIGLIPFGLFSPIYTYELGKRKIIWNFPTIGQKKTPGWGWFVQNVIDYDYRNGHESSVLVDWFQFKGIGLGISHYYQFGRHDGTAYYYHLKEQDTGILNHSLQLKHSIQLTDYWKLSGYYKTTDAERINASGRFETNSKGIQASYVNLGSYFDIGGDETENFLQRFKTISLFSNRRFNQDTIYSFKYLQSDNYIARMRTYDSQLANRLRLPGQNDMASVFKYQGREGILSNTTKLEDQLQATTVISHIFSDQWRAALTIDHLFDLDGNRVTGDYRNFFYKLPEVKIDYTPASLHGYALTSSFTVARYQEHRVFGSGIKRFPSDSEFEGQPNTYIFRQTFSKEWRPFSDASYFSLKSTFDQFWFKTPGFSLFESDSFYEFNIRPTFKYMASRFVQLTTDYNRTFVPEGGNSPFISQFKNGVTNINQLNQNVIFFYRSPDRYSWTHTLGYDYIRDFYTPYSTSILIRPNSKMSYKLSTGADINHLQDYLRDRRNEISNFETAGIFRALLWDIVITPSSNMSLSVHHSQDVNRGLINNSTIRLSFPLIKNPDHGLAIESDFVYDVPDHTRNLVFDSYELATLGITKFNHCRKLKFSYNKIRDEYQVLFTILAFPNESFGFRKNQNVTTFEGFLDKPSQERF